ncbi:MAG TPA: cytochrome c biogenesis protein CcsA [Gammaproteobacteria bacterium]|nr:cytochrome c biogenesis protein CcsA [Gammaproteobacteria bacterium]
MHLLIGTAVLALALYLVAGLGLLCRLFGFGPMVFRGRRGLILSAVVAAVLLHAIALYALVFGAQGMDLGFFNALALVGLLVACIGLAAFLKPAFESLGLVVFPLAGASLLAAELLTHDVLLLQGGGWPLYTHILFSLLAYSLLSVAALQALLLAVQERRLRRGGAGGFLSGLPPLQEMERFLFQLITVGFALLTLALFTGLIFVHNLFTQHLVHKTVLSLLAWFVFAVLLWGRWRFGWRGRTATRWTLAGFVTLMLAYFGSKLVLELILGRHWGLMS